MVEELSDRDGELSSVLLNSVRPARCLTLLSPHLESELRTIQVDAVDIAKSGGCGGDFGVDLVGVDHPCVGQERGQCSQAWLVETWVEDQQQAAFDEVAQRADPFVTDDRLEDGRVREGEAPAEPCG